MRGNQTGEMRKRHRQGSIPAYAGEPRFRRSGSGVCWVYPRVCGGTAGMTISQAPQMGLSPRMRGNHRAKVRAAFRRWSIPAYAGEPPGGASRCDCAEVYPRVCGGTATGRCNPAQCWGLSPRMRGNPTAYPSCQAGRRSIPAYAGEPVLRQLDRVLVRVYPRVCGGTSRHCHPAISDCGLSPRMRGNPALADADFAGRGSIPAYAGEPVSLPR